MDFYRPFLQGKLYQYNGKNGDLELKYSPASTEGSEDQEAIEQILELSNRLLIKCPKGIYSISKEDWQGLPSEYQYHALIDCFSPLKKGLLPRPWTMTIPLTHA